jgi:DNA-directed RNA polymerase subunit L
MLVGLLSSKLNMPKVVVTNRDNALMNVVAKILPETSTLLCYFHIGKNVRAKCITNCRVKPKPNDVEVYGKEVKEVNEEASDVVEKIIRAWKYLVESPMDDSYASAVMRFKDVFKTFPKSLDYVESTILNTFKENFVIV